MKFPATSEELQAGGYVYDNDAQCRGCGQVIEWWITLKGKKMPMSVSNASTVRHAAKDMRQPHWADCPNAEDFRR